MRPDRVWLFFALIGIFATAGSQDKEIIGYYPSWKWRSGADTVRPDLIPFEKLTIINYAFFAPSLEGRVVGRDKVGDRVNLLTPGTRLPELAHRHGVKVFLSIGGWGDSDIFPAVAASPNARAVFAGSCSELIRLHGFDGIDIDWEYPGYGEHNGTASDKENFTLLLTTLRDSLDALGAERGRRYQLTAALPGVAELLWACDMEKLTVLLDQVHVMTYDFVNSLSERSGHNAALYPPNDSDTLRNVDAAFRLYTEVYKFPPSKVNIGIPFFGHVFNGCTSPDEEYSGKDTTYFPGSGASFAEIAARMGRLTRVWDVRAMVPYLTARSPDVFVSYDDAESVRLKAEYVVKHQARGVIIWEITGDRLPDGSTPLLDAVHRTFKLRTTDH